MEKEIIDLLVQSGDTGLLLILISIGYHKLGIRLTIIETILKEKKEYHREDEN